MSIFKKIRNNYVIWHANSIKIPAFSSSIVVRKKVVFSGRVQKVGFRLEVFSLAQRMGISGSVKNIANGNVEAEFQGEEQHISFLIQCMEALKRASVKNITTEDLPICKGKEEFVILR